MFYKGLMHLRGI